MANYESVFAGKEVDRAISKLKNWAAAGFDSTIPNMTITDTYDTVTISSVQYAVIWKVAPSSSNLVYGIGLNTSTGRPYQICNDHGTYSAVALDTDTKTTAGIASSNSKLNLVGAYLTGVSGDNTTTNTNGNVYMTNGTLYAKGLTGVSTLTLASTNGDVSITPNGNNNINLLASNYSGTGKAYYKGEEVATVEDIAGTAIEIVDLTAL